MNGPDVSKMTSMWVWHLADPQAPRKIGTVSLIPATARCSFTYDDAWKESGFSLSPDMPIGRRGDDTPIMPPPGWSANGALEDAMPDRWGQSTIRVIDRPKRLTPLDFLYFAGDRRSGALGVSSNPDVYMPYPDNPLLTTSSMDEANTIIHRIIDRQPLNEKEKRMIQSGRSMGGAQPKMLISIDGEEWIAKFPNGGNVDQPLIEHATMALAREIGIRVVESRAHPISVEHVVMSRRFDRNAGRRIHTLSAKTLLLSEGGESYAAISNVIRSQCAPDLIAEMRRELFIRMSFNILIDNTDDHTKNHAFLRQEDGHYELAPAYDLLPQINGVGKQAIPVFDGAPNDDFQTAVENSASFGLDHEEAVAIWRDVANGVSRWKDVFKSVGVTDSDIDYLSVYIDSEEKLSMRDGEAKPGWDTQRSGKR